MLITPNDWTPNNTQILTVLLSKVFLPLHLRHLISVTQRKIHALTIAQLFPFRSTDNFISLRPDTCKRAVDAVGAVTASEITYEALE